MWAPSYRQGSGTDERFIRIHEAEIDECPVTYVTAQSRMMLEQIGLSIAARDLSGAALFGPNLGEWPAWVVDAFAAISLAKRERDEALMGN